MLNFTDVNTGLPITLPNDSVQEAWEGEGLCRLIDISGNSYDVSETWAQVLNQLQGGPPI